MGDQGEPRESVQELPQVVCSTTISLKLCRFPCSKLRVLFHHCMTVAMDEETQKKGCITIVHALNSDALIENPQSRDPIALWECAQLSEKAMPIRWVGRHMCTNPSSISGKFFSSLVRFAGETGLVRTRFHQGKKKDTNSEFK